MRDDLPKDREFYKTTLTIEILTEGGPWDGELEDLAYSVEHGLEGVVVLQNDLVVSNVGPSEAAAELYRMGSEPGFFNLDDEGNDLDEKEV